jgi:hypothetical protein
MGAYDVFVVFTVRQWSLDCSPPHFLRAAPCGSAAAFMPHHNRVEELSAINRESSDLLSSDN